MSKYQEVNLKVSGAIRSVKGVFELRKSESGRKPCAFVPTLSVGTNVSIILVPMHRPESGRKRERDLRLPMEPLTLRFFRL